MARAMRFGTSVRVSARAALRKLLAPALEDMPPALEAFTQQEHAMVGPRHLARHRHVPPTDQSRFREGLVGRAKRAGRDQRRAVAGEAGGRPVLPHRSKGDRSKLSEQGLRRSGGRE